MRLLSEERRNCDDIKFIKWSAVFLFLFALLGVVVTFKTGRKEIEELGTQAQLFQHCSPARVTQCILLFLPPLAECSQECRERYLKTVARVKSSLKDRPWGWL